LFLFVAIGFGGCFKNPPPFGEHRIAMDVESQVPFSGVVDEAVLGQKYFYLGHGTQAVAFESADGQYVLKFFLMKSMPKPRWFRVPSPRDLFKSHRIAKQERRAEKKKRHLYRALKSYALAFEKFKEETALIALHFSPTQGQCPLCTLIDREGREVAIDLDRACFIVQKRVQKIREANLSREELLAAFDRFFVQRASKGGVDLGRGTLFSENYGLLEGNIILLDPGKLGFCAEVALHPHIEVNRMQRCVREKLR
jgi:hypothetical protein